MATLAAEQEETTTAINSQAVQVEKDTREGYVTVSQDFTFQRPSHSSLPYRHRNIVHAVVHAANARRARWICFCIFLVILVIIAITLGVHFGNHH